MRWLATQSRMEEDRFLTQMKNSGQQHMVKRSHSLRKTNRSAPKESDKPLGEVLVSLYKRVAVKLNMKIHPTIIASLRYKHGLEFDMDCLDGRQELPLFNLIEQTAELKRIRLWSSLTKLDDVDYMMAADNSAYSEYIKSSVRQFFLKIGMVAEVEPQGPTSVRTGMPLSLDRWQNAKLMKAIRSNLVKSHRLQELTLIGYRMSMDSCR